MLREQSQFLSTLNLGKLWNASMILGSYYFGRITGKAKITGMPISLSIEPTTVCNLGCPECPSGLRSFIRPTGTMELPLLRKILDDVKETIAYVNFYFQGEPYLHPQFLEMVTEAKKRNIYTSTSTNAHYLDSDRARATVASGLDRLIISIDGTDQATYEQYRKRGSLDKVIEGTKEVLRWKKALGSSTPKVVFQFLVVKPNEHQIAEVQALGKRLGVDEVKLKTAQIYDHENGSELIPENDRYSRYRQRGDGKWEIKNPLDNHCWRMWSGAVVTWDGKVVPCCFDKDAHYSMGSLGTTSFRDIWHSEAYGNFRSSIMRSRSEIEMCKNCSEGTQVWA